MAVDSPEAIMATLTIDVPERFLTDLKRAPEELEKDVRLAAAIEWFRRGLLSQGRAAELADVPRADFIDELARRKIEVFQVDFEELRAELGLAQPPGH
jgi:predicted HTH domain antitoxin